MATIRPNENAPSEEVKYLLASAEFDLGPGGEYETEDRAVIADAYVHPWLSVEVVVPEELSVSSGTSHVPYEDDVLSAPNSKAFDMDALRAELERRGEVLDSRSAIDAGLDQGEAVEEGGVDLTLAAVADSDDGSKENE